jgi:hypothetical protein
VETIEIAERDDAAAKPLRNRRAAVQPLHGAGYRRRERGRKAGTTSEPDGVDDEWQV